MNAEIIAVGSELLLGQINNTNATFISKSLAELGIDVYYHTVVGDNAVRLTDAVEMASKRANIIILTGGLGPTKDDLTKETIANHIGKTLLYDPTAMESIEAYFLKTNRIMTENNKKQALIINGSTIFKNKNGMAPGMGFILNDVVYILLPGPPSEMEPMFEEYVRPFLLEQMETVERIDSRVLRFFGIGEAELESKLDDLLEKQTNPTIAPLASDGEVTLRITAKHHSVSEAEKMLMNTEKEILDRVGPYFYGYDQSSLMKECIAQLHASNYTIAAAESLTGGMFQEELTKIPGAGLILKGGVVCYTNEAKVKLVQISEKTINEFGVVSEQCALEMADNIKAILGADVGVSLTGVAGPNEMEGNPVGTVYIGIATPNQETIVKKLNLGGMRESNRIRSVKHACHQIINLLK